MAEQVRIEIPITATDQTAAGISSVQNRLTSLERSMQKMQRQIDKISGSHCKVGIDAHDAASSKISDVEDAMQKANSLEAVVGVSIEDAATNTLKTVEDAAAELNGEGAVVEAEAEDAATGVLSDVEDRLSQLHGETGVVEVGAEDAASGTISDVEDRLGSLNGQTATVIIQAEEAASGAVSGAAGRAAGAAKAPIAGAAATMGASFGVYDSINTFGGFESAMSQVRAISGAGGAEFDALNAKAKEMGATTKFTATESAAAFNYMAMAGWKTKDMLSGISGIMNLAAASGEDLATTSDIVTDALTGFGLKASDSTHFADVLAQASANANTNVGLMGESFKYVAPLAGAMNYSIEDTSLALGLMANAGVKGSMAGTSLRRAITALASPTTQEAAAFEKYGISLQKADGSQKSLNEVMTDLRANLTGLSEDEQAAAVSQMFGAQAMSGMLAIINASADDWNKLSDAVTNADGASQAMADMMNDNMQGSFILMQSAIDGVKNSLGERLSPYMRALADGIRDAMPGATNAIEGLMDAVDVKVGHISEKWKNMLSTDEWQSGTFASKINMAFDKMIGEPISKWAKSKGGHLASAAISGMFSDALKILPGGEQAGLTSWLSAGVLFKGGASAVKGIAQLTGALQGFIPAAATVMPAAAGVAAAIGAIAIAVDSYNQKMAKQSLEDHFGDISLSTKQVEAVAEQILNARWRTNIDLALGEISGAEEVRRQAEQALRDNDALEYKNSVGIALTADEQADYKTNIETFVNSKIKELESESYSAKIMVDTMLQTPEGQQLSEAISHWTLSDTIEMTSLSKQLRDAVDKAIEDGIVSVDEQKAISELQQKINGITSRWKQAEAEATMDMIRQKYGSLSGRQLTPESFKNLATELTEQRAENEAALDAASSDFYQKLNAWHASGRLSEAGLDKDVLAKQWTEAVRNARASQSMNSVGFLGDTIGEAYADNLFKNKAANRDSGKQTMDYLNREFRNGNLSFDMLETRFGTMYSSRGVDRGLKDAYQIMKPEVSGMAGLIDEYRDQGQQVPRELMNAFNSAIEMGAAAGDTDAAWQQYANVLAQSGDNALVKGILDGTQQAPEELRTALERATVGVTDDPITMDGITASIEDAEVTKESTATLHKSISDFMGAVGQTGSEAHYNAEVQGVQVTLGEVEVDEPSAAEQIAAALGVTLPELAEMTGVDVVEMEAGATITIPEDRITLNSEGGLTDGIDAGETEVSVEGDAEVEVTNAEEAAQSAADAVASAADSATADTVEIEQQADATVTPGDTDTSQVEDATENALDGISQAGTAQATANVVVGAGTIDTAQAVTATHNAITDAFATTFPTNGSVDVTIEKTGDNISSVYSQVGSEIDSKFSNGYSTSASLHVNIHVDYSIANPTKTVTFSGAGTGSGTITAHALGGYFDKPHIGLFAEAGGEYIIPINGSKRSLEMWKEAGEMLGVNIPAYAEGGLVGTDEDAMAVNPFEKKGEPAVVALGRLFNSRTNTSQEDIGSVLAAAGTSQGAAAGSSSGVNVNVNLNPVIQIEGSGMDEEEVFDVMKRRIKECADDVGMEVGEKLAQIFGNMPLAQVM